MDQWTADSFENIGSKYVHTVYIVEHYVYNIYVTCVIQYMLWSPDAFLDTLRRIHVEHIFVQDPQDPGESSILIIWLKFHVKITPYPNN